MTFSEEYGTSYFFGHVDTDGSLVGSKGWGASSANHSSRFILRRVSPQVMCHRPSPTVLSINKPHALWTFATGAVRAQVRQNLWKWSFFAERRRIRLRHLELDLRIRRYWGSLDAEETDEHARGLQAMTSCDANFYRMTLDEYARVAPSHQ